MRSTPEISARIWIVRHGISTFNAAQRYQGSSDEPQLTVEGREAARLTGQYLSGCGIRSVVTSPLGRARQTAHEIFECLSAGSNHPVVFTEDERLREIDLPLWEGLAFGEVRQRFPEQYEAWQLRPQSMRMASVNGELRYPVLDLFTRVRGFWDNLLTTQRTGDVVLVTHGGAGRALINSALGLGPERFHDLQLSNCGVARLKVSRMPRRVVLETLNVTAHLGDRLPKLKEGRTGIRFLFVPAGDGEPERKRWLARILADTPIETAFVAGADEGALGDIFPGPSAFPIERVQPETLGPRVREASAGADLTPLANVAVIGAASSLCRGFQTLLALEDPGGISFPLYPATITAVHCPGGRRRPVLQGMNLFERARVAAGGVVA